jgi:hypothetical protein
LADHFGDLVIADLPRRARTGLVQQTRKTMLGKAPSPLAYRVGGDVDPQADVFVLCAFRGQKHDARALPCAVFRREAKLSSSRHSLSVRSIATAAVLPTANPPAQGSHRRIAYICRSGH